MLDCTRWGFTAKAINQFEAPDLYYQREAGVFVFGVKFPGNAAEAGLRPRDILVKIDDQDLTDLTQVRAVHQKALTDLPQRHRVMLTVLRNGLPRQVALDYSRDYEKK